jgi:hypothetical protein
LDEPTLAARLHIPKLLPPTVEQQQRHRAKQETEWNLSSHSVMTWQPRPSNNTTMANDRHRLQGQTCVKINFFSPLKPLELLMYAITLRDNVHLSVVELWHCVHEIKDNEVDSSGCLGDDDGDNLVLGVLFCSSHGLW